jgi:hypothetical protein
MFLCDSLHCAYSSLKVNTHEILQLNISSDIMDNLKTDGRDDLFGFLMEIATTEAKVVASANQNKKI